MPIQGDSHEYIWGNSFEDIWISPGKLINLRTLRPPGLSRPNNGEPSDPALDNQTLKEEDSLARS